MDSEPEASGRPQRPTDPLGKLADSTLRDPRLLKARREYEEQLHRQEMEEADAAHRRAMELAEAAHLRRLRWFVLVAMLTVAAGCLWIAVVPWYAAEHVGRAYVLLTAIISAIAGFAARGALDR